MLRAKASLSLASAAALRVEEVMTPDPLSVAPTTPLSEILAVMEERSIQHFPVIRDGHVVGLVSERHLRDAMPSVLTVDDPEARRRFLKVTHAEQVMMRHPPTINPDALLLEAIGTMRVHRAGSLPVVRAGRLVGILSSGDLISLLERLLKSAPAAAPAP